MFSPRVPQLRSIRGRTFATSTTLSSLNAVARPKAQQLSADWKGTSATGGTTKNFIGGEFVESKTTEWIDLPDPVTNLLLLLAYS